MKRQSNLQEPERRFLLDLQWGRLQSAIIVCKKGHSLPSPLCPNRLVVWAQIGFDSKLVSSIPLLMIVSPFIHLCVSHVLVGTETLNSGASPPESEDRWRESLLDWGRCVLVTSCWYLVLKERWFPRVLGFSFLSLSRKLHGNRIALGQRDGEVIKFPTF